MFFERFVKNTREIIAKSSCTIKEPSGEAKRSFDLMIWRNRNSHGKE
jgi:hypothetical protein